MPTPPAPPMQDGLWTNWSGTQTARPAEVLEAHDEQDVARIVADVAGRGSSLRVVGSAHSGSALCVTDATLLSLEPMRGILEVDTARRRARALPATRVAEFGPRLWDTQHALYNQGDIDTQHIAGAVSTSTHGSGLGLGSFSSTVTKLRLATAAEGVIEIDETQPELLQAARVSLGMLGVITELELELDEAFTLREHTDLVSFESFLEEWDELFSRYSFGVWWMPNDKAAEYLPLGLGADARVGDMVYVRTYDRLAVDAVADDVANVGTRQGRPYLVYPYDLDPNHCELEYMVPFDQGKDAFLAVREMMLREHPDEPFPVEGRATRRDDALLSPNYGYDTFVISCSGVPGTHYEPFLRDVDRVLQDFDGRPHWGKLHYLTRDRLPALFPQYERFVEIRRELDPDGVFLNDHLRELFG